MILLHVYHCRETFPLGVSCFCASCEQKHSPPFLDYLSKDVSIVSVDLWNKEQICLLSGEMNIMSPSRAKGRFASAHYKGFCFLRLEALNCDKNLLCAQHPCGPLCAPHGNWGQGEIDANMKLILLAML